MTTNEQRLTVDDFAALRARITSDTYDYLDVLQLLQEHDAVRRERDEARKDSARLDWLADNRREIGLYSPTDASPIWMIVLPDTRPDTMRDSMTLNGESILCPNVVVQATTLRDVIDAAMAKDGDQ